LRHTSKDPNETPETQALTMGQRNMKAPQSRAYLAARRGNYFKAWVLGEDISQIAAWADVHALEVERMIRRGVARLKRNDERMRALLLGACT
jgi:hypothetical protein